MIVSTNGQVIIAIAIPKAPSLRFPKEMHVIPVINAHRLSTRDIMSASEII